MVYQESQAVDPVTADEHIASLEAVFRQRPADPQNKEWVKAKLQHMVEVDQYLRSFMNPPYPERMREQIASRCQAVDRQNTADMKELLRIWGWITISDFGEEADKNAWLLVQHADEDHEFQKQSLKKLEALYPKGETRPANYAYLHDRVSIAIVFNKLVPMGLQRYGTQMTSDGAGGYVPRPVEDPEHLDERRKQMGLPPMAEYLKRF